MKNFLIQYQFEDEEPDKMTVRAKDEDDAVGRVETELRSNLLDEGILEREEVNHLIDTMQILEVIKL